MERDERTGPEGSTAQETAGLARVTAAAGPESQLMAAGPSSEGCGRSVRRHHFSCHHRSIAAWLVASTLVALSPWNKQRSLSGSTRPLDWATSSLLIVI